MPQCIIHLLQSIQILTNGMNAFRERLVEGIEADPDRCRDWMEQSLALATALNPVIGYDRAAEVAKKAYREDKTIRQVVVEDGLLSEEEAGRVLDVRRMVP